ncbi:MAG: hypothetical protein V4515_14655 [Chloroflexota bacterium]
MKNPPTVGNATGGNIPRTNEKEAADLRAEPDDRLIRNLTRWLMQSGWVNDYEHARAEAEGFASAFAAGSRP